MKTIVLITNIPTPYRIPLFNLLNKEIERYGWNLHVIFSSKGYKRRQFELNEQDFKFKYTFLDGGKYSIGKDAEKTFFFYRGLWRQLKTIQPAHIIASGFSPATLMCTLWNLVKGTPFSIWSGTIEKGNRKTPWWRRIFRKLLLSRASSFIAYGSMAAQYLEKLGAPKERIHIAINTVDTTFFSRETDAVRQKNSGNKLFTFACIGYLVPRKNVHKVIEAARLLSERRRDFKINIIGDGISKSQLERTVNEYNLNDIISFTGYIQKQGLPAQLAITDVLLFQTDFDIWGLVLNEAMAAGVACLVSPNAGASYDLIKEGVTGFINDYSLAEKTARKMEWMIDNPAIVKEIGTKAAIFITETATLNNSVNGFIRSIQQQEPSK